MKAGSRSFSQPPRILSAAMTETSAAPLSSFLASSARIIPGRSVMSASSRRVSGVSIRRRPCSSAQSLPVQPSASGAPAQTSRVSVAGAPCRATSAVSSPERSSTRTTRRLRPWRPSAASVSPMTAASSRAGIRTVTSSRLISAASFPSSGSSRSRTRQGCQGSASTQSQRAAPAAASPLQSIATLSMKGDRVPPPALAQSTEARSAATAIGGAPEAQGGHVITTCA